MTTIYALTGQRRDGARLVPARHYYATEQAARDALPDLVLTGTLRHPIAVEQVEVHGPVLGSLASGALHELRIGLAEVLDDGDVLHMHVGDVVERVRSAVRGGKEVAEHLRNAGAATLSDLLDMYRAEGQVEVERAARIDPERERRRRTVEQAAQAVARQSDLNAQDEVVRALRATVAVLREYAPAETTTPGDDERTPAPGLRLVRDELHKLAPLPWRASAGDVIDRDNYRVAQVDGAQAAAYATDKRIAALLVQLVNASERASVTVHDGRIALAEQAVLDAAREHIRAGRAQNLAIVGTTAAPLARAVDALAALTYLGDAEEAAS